MLELVYVFNKPHKVELDWILSLDTDLQYVTNCASLVGGWGWGLGERERGMNLRAGEKERKTGQGIDS